MPLPPLRSIFPLPQQIPITSPLLTGYRNARYLKHRWYPTLQTAGFSPLPTIHHLRIHSLDGNQIKARIDMARGESTPRDLIQQVPLLQSLLRVHRIRVEHFSSSVAEITVTFLPPPPPSHSPRLGGPADKWASLDLERLPILLDNHRAAIHFTKSILLGGESESGKSNLTWHILDLLNTAQIPYALWVIDPAGGVELSELEGATITESYADRPKQADSLIRGFHESMETRLRLMKQRRQKRHFPTPAEPLKICIIDELLLVKSALQADDVTSPMGETLAVGRKALHIVIGCSQLGQKASIGQIRDLFPQRICLRTRTREATDTVLGTGATEAGAACHRISQSGEGYVYTDRSEQYEKILVPLVTNHHSIANPPSTNTL